MILALIVGAVLAAQPLAGPVASPPVERISLVRYDFNSKLRRPEATPEEEAVGLMELPKEARARVDEVFARRAAGIDRFVSGNLFLLQELDTAGKAGDKWGQFVLVMRAVDELKPVLGAGQLRDQVARVLPAAEAGKFRALVDEYWAAAVRESVHEARAAGKKDARWQVELGERFRHLTEEIVRSYERQAASGTLFVDYFMANLDLSEEQVKVINGLKLEMLQRTNMRPSEKDQQQLAIGALAYLNERQRGVVLKRLTGK
jgi:hypothetical protein